MRLVCAIDNLGSGGAQRQMTSLSCFLKARGHDVQLLTYHPANFFLPEFERRGIPVTCIQQVPKLARPLAYWKFLRRESPDAVLAFLEGPSFYAELAGLPTRKWGLVVSERIQISKRSREVKRMMHRFADYVTVNSHANRHAIASVYPEIADRLVTVYNCLDLAFFKPLPAADQESCVRFVVAATLQARKNTHGLIRAAAILKKRHPQVAFRIHWYGEHTGAPGYRVKMESLVAQLGVQANFSFHGPSRDMPRTYASADAVILPSFQEGLPNVVCEAMACGKPILTSAIGDAAMLMDAANGHSFDPADPEDIARALAEFCARTASERRAMGEASRKRAERLFDPAPIVASYESLLESAGRRQRTQIVHWPPDPVRAAIKVNMSGLS